MSIDLASTLPLLLRLQRWLPRAVGAFFLERYWLWFWATEEREEIAATGIIPRQPIRGSERATLTESIARSYPFDSLLEVGCGWGQNFFTIAKQYRQLTLDGIDIDVDRIAKGQQLLDDNGFRNVSLAVADARQLEMIPDAHYDLVITSGFLLCVSPEELPAVLSELIRVARKRVICMEQIEPSAEGFSTGYTRPENGSMYWTHDLALFLSQHYPQLSCTVEKVADPRWHLEHWQSTASVVEITLPM